MITIITRRETGWFDYELGPVTEKNIWEQLCNAFGVNRLILVPTFEKTTLEQYDTVREALTKVEGVKVFLEIEKRAREIGREPIYLKDFKHPKNAVYIFGNSQTDNSRYVKKDDVLVSVETPNPQDPFGFNIACAVLYDRKVKDGT
jgi:hypothetical protein